MKSVLVLIFSFSLLGQDVVLVKHRSAAAVPTLIQSAHTPTDVSVQGGPFTTQTNYVCFANATQVGNVIIAKVRTGQTALGNVSLSDNGSTSNVYTQQSGASETAGSRTTAIYTAPVLYASNCVAAAFITVAHTDNELEVYEYENLSTATVDVACSGTATTGTAPACGSAFSPTSGDLVMAFVDVVTFSAKPTGAMTFTAQTGATPTYSLLHADGTTWSASQAGVLASSSSITPSITLSQATTRANIVGVAFKAGASGAAYTGIHVNSVTTFAPQYANSTGISSAKAQVIQLPCTGNDLWFVIGEGASGSTTNVSSVGTDSNSNTWAGLTNLYSAGDGFAIQWWHTTTAGGATCNGTEKFTINFTANPTFITVVAFDISNSSGYDSSATCGSGSTPCAIDCENNSSFCTTNAPPVQTGATITPSTANGVILSYQNQDFNSVSAVNTGTFVAPTIQCPEDTTACGGAGVSTTYAYVGNGLNQDCGAVVKYHSSTSAVGLTWTIANTQNSATTYSFSSTVNVKQ